ncbi:MAG: chromosome segregation protein SMC, partial [Armatimonadetes bacterium]|nr:chromosome segregation protein SMC [Armatimonadota bacterium]
MYLKRLEMRGFKTFADRTELEFGPGLTGIVGPNGVGKSNITDAILWALGEQSQRAIRTQTSQDVIFSGSEQRHPLGLAEVRLLLDNEDGALPIEFTEVEVYRRLYRSGESEYGINKSACRLRDVHDLFVDTGVGQAAYSLVGQGDVEAILSARSETRRELMEEVAGIGKYRRRRQEAQRKLDATEANVRRISDIIYELASQREPLEKQAEKARQYRELDNQLRGLELTLLALDYKGRHERLGKLANDEQITRADMEGTRAKLNLAEAEIEQIAATLHELESELAAAREQARVAEREADQTERTYAVTTEKLRAVRERLADLDGTDEQGPDREQQLSARLEELRAQQREDRERAEEMAGRLETLRAELQEAEESRRAATESRRQLQQQHSELLRAAEGGAREVEALQSMQQELQERVERLAAQREALLERRSEAQRRLEEVTAQRDEVAREVEEARRKLERHTRLHEALSRTLRDHRAKRAILAGAATAAEARLALLEELDREHEGYQDTVRAVLEAARKGELQGIRGVVGDMLEVPAKYETAIEAALGEQLQWIVTDTQEQAVAAVEYLRERGMGYATFLPLASLSMVATQAALASGDGCLGLASRLVKSAPRMNQITEHLLGNVAVMRDLPAALRLTRRIGYQARAVTLDGTVVERNGAIRGGTLSADAGQTFGRRRERDQVAAELEELKRALAATWECEERLDKA